LLLLQLLALMAMLLALAGPMLHLSKGPGRRYVVLIDRSASMNATDVTPSRLAEAKKQAKVFIESLRSGSAVSLRDSSDHAMVIAFDRHAKVMCNFTSDRRQLAAAIDAIESGDGVSQLGEAVTVARAFAQSSGGENGTAAAEAQAKLVLFSDGRIRDLETIVVAEDEMVFHQVGQSRDNVAVTAMRARRSYEQPEQVEVFATLANYGSEAVTCDVQLGINGDVRGVRSVTIPGCQVGAEDQDSEPGKIAVNFTLDHSGDGVLEVRHLRADALACDDAAWSILEPPGRLSVLLVTQDNPVLESALRACPIARLDPCSPAGFDAMDPVVFDLEYDYDVIVLDNHVPAHVPRCRYLAIGAVPAGIDVNTPRDLENQVVVDWRARHPVLQHVNLDNLFAAQSKLLELPRDADVLAEFNDSPALALLRRNGSTFLLTSFDVLQSNWPFEPSFVLFCYNALSFLATQEGTEQHELGVAEPIALDDVPAETTVTVTGPDGPPVELQSGSSGMVRFPGTYRVGIYAVEVPNEAQRFYAVNLLDPEESRLEPREKIVLSSTTVAAQGEAVARANVPLWPFLVLAALVLACVEWVAYNLKVRI